MVAKKKNSLIIETKTRGLPIDWRVRLTDTVKQVGKAYNLYITKVDVGLRREPPGIFISVKREGSDEAWTDKVESVLHDRVMDVIHDARREEVARQVTRLGFASTVSFTSLGAATKITAKEPDYVDESTSPQIRAAQRLQVARDVRQMLDGKELEAEAQDFVTLALDRMRYPRLWALWARLLLMVEEVEMEIPQPMQKRIRDLL